MSAVHADSDRSPRRTVGIYERPHPFCTRKVLVPTATFVIVAIGYAIYFLLR
ncbi:MAG TPA: hypothetical protein VKV24_00705 [Casimicrobiaceae bacterium]|nr:hypothetical protein [Casimicrobiaceae bacterium]